MRQRVLRLAASSAIRKWKSNLLTARVSVGFVVASSVLVALATLRVFPLGLDLAFAGMPHQIAQAKAAFVLHISASSIALVLGAYQLLPTLRRRHRNVHRWVGRCYAIAVLVGSISAGLMAFEIANSVATLGFAILAVLWLATTVKAVQLARANRIADHRKWMICSFSLTFAAVTLRLQLLVSAVGFGMPYDQIYPFLAWSCWVPNILFAIWYSFLADHHARVEEAL